MQPLFLCPVLDSNQHILSNSTPSRWRVYQFHQLGNFTANIIKSLERLEGLERLEEGLMRLAEAL